MMSENRFLRKEDYAGSISDEHLMQVSNNYDESIFKDAEDDAEISVIEHMFENYEIEEALNVGKMIYDYNTDITYPKGVYFWYEDKVVKTLKEIVGARYVAEKVYWGAILEPTDEDQEAAQAYSQMIDFYDGDIVLYNEGYFLCLETNGYNFQDIRIPGVTTIEDAEAVEPIIGENIMNSDPRNKNLKKHMTQLALFELFKRISPNNISITIVNDYEISMKWLEKCSKMKINPQIPRRVDKETGRESTDWAFATFGPSTSGNDWML